MGALSAGDIAEISCMQRNRGLTDKWLIPNSGCRFCFMIVCALKEAI